MLNNCVYNKYFINIFAVTKLFLIML